MGAAHRGHAHQLRRRGGATRQPGSMRGRGKARAVQDGVTGGRVAVVKGLGLSSRRWHGGGRVPGRCALLARHVRSG